jgi:hypothetical protein
MSDDEDFPVRKRAKAPRIPSDDEMGEDDAPATSLLAQGIKSASDALSRAFGRRTKTTERSSAGRDRAERIEGAGASAHTKRDGEYQSKRRALFEHRSELNHAMALTQDRDLRLEYEEQISRNGLLIHRLGRKILLPQEYMARLGPWTNTDEQRRIRDARDKRIRELEPVIASRWRQGLGDEYPGQRELYLALRQEYHYDLRRESLYEEKMREAHRRRGPSDWETG